MTVFARQSGPGLRRQGADENRDIPALSAAWRAGGAASITVPAPQPLLGDRTFLTGEVRIDTGANSHHDINTSLGRLSNGGFVASFYDDTSQTLFRQVYNAASATILGNVGVNSSATPHFTESISAGLYGGGFVVIWKDATLAGPNFPILAQRYDITTGPAGGEFAIDDQDSGHTSDSWNSPSLTALEGGGFLVAWQTESRGGTARDIDARLFDAVGNRVGSQLHFFDLTNTTFEDLPSVVGVEGGGFVGSWAQGGANGGDPSIHSQRFDAAGSKVGAEIVVVTAPAITNARFDSAALDFGGFVVVWREGDETGNLYARAYDAAGNALGDKLIVYDPPAGQYLYGWTVTSLAGGGFVVGYTMGTNPTLASPATVMARAYDAGGHPYGDPFAVSTTAGGKYLDVEGAVTLADGSVLFSWDTDATSANGSAFYRRLSIDTGVAPAILGTPGVDSLNGTANADRIRGLDGADTLNGLAGADRLEGGNGDDFYFVDNGADRAVEAAGGGADRVFAAVSYTLEAGSSVETLSTTNNAGTAAINLTGNEFAQSIVGNAGANVLDGKAGADVMAGLQGDDFYYVDNATDRVAETTGQGNDRVFASASYVLGSGLSVETLTTSDNAGAAAINLTGNALAQAIVGNAGANALDSGGGGDTMVGLGGDDFYFIRAAADRAVEAAGGGADRVFAAVSYTLEAGSSVETLSTTNNAGTAAINLTGNEFAQSIVGNAGANVLDGKAGADVMAGLQGDDFYYVDNAADRVAETTGQGNDRVFASASYVLGSGLSVETLTTSDNAGAAAINLTGNALAQAIVGNAGANALDSGGGGDTMMGLGGDDFYYVRAAGDRAAEAAGGGNDRVFATVSFTLEAGSSVEVLSTASNGGTTAINLTGNELANTLIGNSGANILDGKSGADTLAGSAGADGFAFTTVLGGGNIDRIVDFQGGLDKLRLDDAIFTGIGTPGAFNVAAFVTGNAAADGNDRIVYNSATGQLFYDADGTGSGAAVLFATLDGHPALTASDFMVI